MRPGQITIRLITRRNVIMHRLSIVQETMDSSTAESNRYLVARGEQIALGNELLFLNGLIDAIQAGIVERRDGNRGGL